MNFEALHEPRKAAGRWTRVALLLGIIYFGFIFPDSLSDHTKLVHFAAHMGMSFFVASCVYVVSSLMLRLKKVASLTLLIAITTIIGAIYKYLEISSQGMLDKDWSLGLLLKLSGSYTSMSQNTAGLLAAILLIEYVVHRVPALLSPLLTAAAPFRPSHPRTGSPRA